MALALTLAGAANLPAAGIAGAASHKAQAPGKAASDGAGSGKVDPVPDWKACLPEGVDKGQVRNALRAWLAKYPRYNEVSAIDLMFRVQGWLTKHPEFRDAGVSALLDKAESWLDDHPEFRNVAAGKLIAMDLAKGLPCK